MSSTNFHNYYDDGFSSPYYVAAGRIAATTSIQTPNQLMELQQRLNLGVKNVEISGPLEPDTFDQIPIQHFAEMKRLAQLTGAKASLHAPMFDLAGFSDQNTWSEDERRKTEEHFKSIIERASAMDPDGNIPVTIHTTRSVVSNIPDKSLGVYTEEKAREIGMPELAGREIPRVLVAVDREEGKLLPLRYEEKDYLGQPKKWMPHERLENANYSQWENEKLQVLSRAKDRGDVVRRMNDIFQESEHLQYGLQHGVKLTSEEEKQLLDYSSQLKTASNYVKQLDDNIGMALKEMGHKLKKYGKNLNPENQSMLQDLQRDWEQQYKSQPEEFKKIKYAKEQGNERLAQEIKANYARERDELQQKTLATLSSIDHPNVLVTADEFVAEKASETIVNTALHAYHEFKDKAPTLAIENWRPEFALSRGQTFQEFISKAKNDFAKELVKKENLSEQEAQDVSNKLIGATWDVAHINMLRRFGYSEKDIVAEASRVKGSDVKKIHLADNFGYADSHLVTGMGNVPTFDQLRELEKTGLKKEIPQIGEFGAFDVNFKESSFPHVLQALGSPLYSYEMQPRWGNIWETYGNYFSGHGMILPDVHFRDLYGAGFSTLPKELGGQVGGDKSRFSGTPNQ